MSGAATEEKLREQLRAAGLEIGGFCERIAERGPQLLHNAALLEDFTPEEVGILGGAMLLVRAHPGQALITEGQVGDWMLLLLSGTVDVTKRSPGGEVSRLAVIRQGTSFGEMSMLDGELRYATCVAIDEVEAGVIGRHAIAWLIREHPAVGAKLLVKITQLMAQRLRNTSNQLIRMLEKQ
ncbi:cyclic nucleotide-binding domain-containing protein [Variovorax terrae]|uniref:Cyclic nucleotide-binding domain-containing protein n=1 Tax=Variovorax terrae TaxID=2923278 RepID=A0A9X1VX12_9BURK|nr:cyclic nucleotide-binding domain-containing protein [Variovorax terrae]MCJ0765391.1 cyclic nucleotide-binding domain-containing protein [Variovorax terrae]